MDKRIQNTGLTAAALALLIAGGNVMANNNDPPTDRAETTGTADADRTKAADRTGDASDRNRDATARTDGNDSDQPIDDTWITTKVKASLLADEDVAGLQVDVETVNGVVTLSGDVDSQAQVEEAKRIARGIEGVKDVDAKNLRVEGTASR